MKIIRYLVAVVLSIGVLRLIPLLICHINEGYPLASLIREILVILLFGGLAILLFVWKKKHGEIKKFSEVPIKNINPNYFRMRKDYKDRFKLWQGRQITLLNWSINIIVTLNVATIVFWGQLFADEKIYRQELFGFQTNKVAVIILMISLAFGVSSLWIRMNDFRSTLKILKLRKLKLQVENGLIYFSEKKENAKDIDNKIISLRKKNDELGDVTQCLFKAQLVVYVVGLILLTLSIK